MHALTAHAIFIILLIALIVSTTMILFWKWYASAKTEANALTCRMKLQSYCLDLIAGKNPKWDEIPPKEGCEKFEIVQPSEDECREMIK